MKVLTQRYTFALILAAKEANALEMVKKDIERLGQLMRDELNGNQFKYRILSPLLSKVERKTYLLSLFSDANELTKNFFAVIMDKGREKILFQVPETFQEILRKLEGLVIAKITSTRPLEANELEMLRKKLVAMLNKKVECVIDIDPSLISGMIIEVEGRRYDSSLKRKIEDLRTVLTN